MKNVTKKNQKIPYLFLLMLFSCLMASAQSGITVRGTVFDNNGETVIGASVVLKGNKMQIRYAERMDCLLKCLYLSIN